MSQNIPLIVATFLRAHWRWQHLRGDALPRFQEQRAQRIVAYAQQHSPFYRSHWAGHALHDWRSLPTVDKHVMMENFDTFNTRQITRDNAMHVALEAERSRNFSPTIGDITVGLSSGTSGHRGLFLANAGEQALWAGTILARTLHHLRPKKLRVAFFLRSNNNLYEQIGGMLLQFRYFDLMLPIEQAIRQLNEFQPDIVVGPPSLLGFLADAYEKGKLHIKPERLVAVAEVLEPHDKEQLAAVFKAPIHQIYQCTEGLLAVCCERGALHIQEDAVVLQFEPLDESNSQRVMPIVTDLWRTTQPIIRYRLNDILQLDPQPCPCGSSFRVIRAIEGRCDDICYFESRAGGTRTFFPDTIRRMILLASPHISDYQVVQERDGQLHIRLAIANDATFEEIAQDVQASVARTVEQYECSPAMVTIEQGLVMQQAGVKRRRVQRIAAH